ncbi:MAG: carbohydrate-binding family 9-like protein [Bacteroidetes bacterium]|nr:carbohydrate-binding family 9-like protein [Bacteroidota bacterium]
MSPSISSEIHDNAFVYKLRKIDHELPIDCNWSKEEWTAVEPLRIIRSNSWPMMFKPETTVKLCYNDKYVYLIYRVEDSFVRCLTTSVNGEVHKDACVEFFFSPTENIPRGYFNLEINCGGTIKLGHRNGPKTEVVHARKEDVNKIMVCHSLPGIIEREIEEPVIWFLEIALPFEILKSYSSMRSPDPGTKWRANFYKCAENNSHPHWMSWVPINSPTPNFHLPEFFGEVEFR